MNNQLALKRNTNDWSRSVPNKITPILFLDLDGTVRKGPKELGRFVNGPADVELFDGVLDIMRSYKARAWRIVAISNQGGIALGKVGEHEVIRGMEETSRLCARLFDRMYWCTHHPDAASEDEAICLCRKPNIANVVAAMISLAQQHGETYRPDQCLMVGDMESDRQLALNAKMPFMLAEKWRETGPLV